MLFIIIIFFPLMIMYLSKKKSKIEHIALQSR